MLVGEALDVAFALESVETIKGGFVGRNLAAELDLADKGGLAMLREVVLEKIEYCLLLVGERKVRQTGLRRSRKWAIKNDETLPYSNEFYAFVKCVHNVNAETVILVMTRPIWIEAVAAGDGTLST